MFRLLLVTKKQIDAYFSANYENISDTIRKHRSKCATANVVDITTDIYLICVDRCHKITEDKIMSFIGSVALNLYKYSTSPLNYKTNRVFANDIDFCYIYEEEDEESLDVQVQNMEYVFEKYLSEAKPSERLFFDLYINQGVRSVRKIKERLNISHYGAWVLITEFKTKMKDYERKAKIKS